MLAGLNLRLVFGRGLRHGAPSFRVLGSKKHDQADQRLALSASINGRSCTHGYDCCGCASTYASVRKVKPGVFAVQARTSYNY